MNLRTAYFGTRESGGAHVEQHNAQPNHLKSKNLERTLYSNNYNHIWLFIGVG